MTENKAKEAAQRCANLMNAKYIALPAGNGHWMCERLEFATKNYDAKKVSAGTVFSPRA